MADSICNPNEHNFKESKFHYGFEVCIHCGIVREPPESVMRNGYCQFNIGGHHFVNGKCEYCNKEL